MAAGIVLLVPGGALAAWLPIDSHGASARFSGLLSSAANTMADAMALSLAFTAVVGLGLFVIGVHLAAAAVVALYLACLAALAFALFWRSRSGPRLLQRFWGAGLLVLLLFGGLAAWRLYQARTLALPAWVDSVHHALIVRLILERGGIPGDFSPYLPVPFYYHYGFHLAAALFALLARVSPEQALLWFGQVLNAAVALSVYRAAGVIYLRSENLPWLSGDTQHDREAASPAEADVPSPRGSRYASWVPAAAALLTGFVFQMPAYYLTWGRYTLLAGLILVGPTIAAALRAWDNPRQWAAWLRLALLVAGLCLTHYFALLIAGLFLGIAGFAGLVRVLRARGDPSRRAFLWRLAVFAALGLMVASPWIWRVWAFSRENAAVEIITPLDGPAAYQNALDYLKYLGYLVGPRRNHILFAFAGLGLLNALRQPRQRFLAAWAALLGLLSLPWGLRLNPFRPDHFAIVLFFPAALLLAGLLADGAGSLASLPWLRAGRRLGGGLLALALVLLSAWGISGTRDILNPVTVVADRADVQALEWIRQHTPVDARFYINAAYWQANTYRGVDGGYWLLPYTGRVSLVPPAVYAWGSPEYVAKISQWAKSAVEIKGCTPEFWNVVRDAGLTHVYLHQGQGSLQPDALAGCSGLRQVYQVGGVFIYEVASRQQVKTIR